MGAQDVFQRGERIFWKACGLEDESESLEGCKHREYFDLTYSVKCCFVEQKLCLIHRDRCVDLGVFPVKWNRMVRISRFDEQCLGPVSPIIDGQQVTKRIRYDATKPEPKSDHESRAYHGFDAEEGGSPGTYPTTILVLTTMSDNYHCY